MASRGAFLRAGAMTAVLPVLPVSPVFASQRASSAAVPALARWIAEIKLTDVALEEFRRNRDPRYLHAAALHLGMA